MKGHSLKFRLSILERTILEKPKKKKFNGRAIKALTPPPLLHQA